MTKIVKGHTAALFALVLTLTPLTPAFASDQSFIVGSLLTENNEPVSSTNVNFYGKTSQLWTNTQTDKNGRILAQLPKGDYTVYVSGYPSSKTRCLNAEFSYQVSEDRQSLNITTPKFKDYTISYLTEATGQVVGNVSTTFNNVSFKSIDNEELGVLTFGCRRQFITTFGQAKWSAFEVDQAEMDTKQTGTGNRSNYMYRNGTGQMVTTNLVGVDWGSSIIKFMIPDLPNVTFSRKSLRISNGTLTGKAVFVEADVLQEFELNRKFKVTFRVIGGSRTTNWISRSTKSASIRGNQVSFKMDTQFYKGKKIQVMLTGSNFSLGTNVVTVKIPK